MKSHRAADLSFILSALLSLLVIWPGVIAAGKDPYTEPPGGLSPKQVPQFVVIGFDDNNFASGMDWASELFRDKRNPAGKGNKSTFDGEPARVSFYMNTLGLDNRGQDRAEALKSSIRRLHAEGHEIGNHTHNHHADLNWMPWNKFQNLLSRMTNASWQERIAQCSNDLHVLSGLPRDDIQGFRAPYLSYNQAMLDSLLDQGFTYDCSIEEGYSTQFDGTNFRWPYRLDQGSPGHNETWRNNALNPDRVIINATPGLWELPNHVLIVPNDKTARQYGIPAGLWQRMKKRLPEISNHRITGFDYNLWSKVALSKQEMLGLLKYNLDLRIQGNRAPFLFGAHTDYYTRPVWIKHNVPNASMQEMQETIAEFIHYALSKPMVRIRPARDIIDWVQHPVPL